MLESLLDSYSGMMLLKTDEERHAELAVSLRLIHKCCQHFQETKDDCYLIGVLSQLRALVAFDPRKPAEPRRGPLLLSLAEAAGVELLLYSRPPRPEHGPEGLAASIIASQTWSVDPIVGYQEYRLRDWLLARAFHVDSTNAYRSRNDVIRQLTDKGAVHYDEEVGEIVDSMRRTTSSRFNGIQFFVLDASKAIFYLGTRYLRIREARSSGAIDPQSDASVAALDREFANSRLSMT